MERIAGSGTWILDPLGTSPLSALEAARAGYRVLVVSNNPILAFLLEILASAPSPADIQSALAALGSTKRGEERLEVHLRSLYRTPCASCGAEVTADAFLWKRGEKAPYARIYRCPVCKDEGERPAVAEDLDRLALIGSDALHRARALERVAEREDDHYPAVQEALDTYLPRPLYALQTMINRTEGSGVTPGQRKLLQALLISACDAANTLWPYPSARSRPRLLAVPPQFRENNLWLALEEAAVAWAGAAAHPGGAVSFSRWPDPPPAEGGICLYAGRAKGLFPLPDSIQPTAALAVFPRPNQAFWTLCALWSGWLWGREAAMPLHSFLGRRRFDWNWHTLAMHSPLSTLPRLLPAGSPLVGLISELAPGFLAAVLSSASASGLEIDGLALRAEEEIAQVLWRVARPGSAAPTATMPAETVFTAAIQAELEARAEPAPYLPLYAAGLLALAREGGLLGLSAQLPADLMTRIQALTGRVFANRKVLRRFEAGSQDDERSLWWFATPPPQTAVPVVPFGDRVEMEIVRIIQKAPGIQRDRLDEMLCRSFPDLQTPPTELMRTILDSYAEEIPGTEGGWRLLAQEDPAARRAELEEARRMLRSIGQRMGFTVSGEAPLVWTPGSFGPVYFFYPIASSIVSRYIFAGLPGPSSQVVMVFPGSRARLLSYKLRRDPRLAEMVKGIHLLKFRHLRAIFERPELRPGEWDGMLDADPPFFEEAEQMRLI